MIWNCKKFYFENLLQHHIQWYVHSLTEVAYRAPAKRGACSTKKGQDTKFYERCQCSNEDMSTCKAHCDEDENCKGFVGPTEWNACQWATTSECPTGCSKYDEGSVGNILLDEEYHKDNYPGCFVKLESISS